MSVDSSIHSIGEDVKGNAIGDVLIVYALGEQLLVRMTSCCPLKNTTMKAMKRGTVHGRWTQEQPTTTLGRILDFYFQH